MKRLFLTLTLSLVAALSVFEMAAATSADIVGNWYAYREKADIGFGLGCNYEFHADGTMLLNAAINGSTPYTLDENTTLPIDMQFLIVAPGVWTFDGSTLDITFDNSNTQFELVEIYINNESGKGDENTVKMMNMLLNSEEMRAEFKKEMQGSLTEGFNGETFSNLTVTADTMSGTSAEGDFVNFERH